MKIKTITCHDVYNHGASLQAYALMKFLQNNGHEVEIIDYKPDYLSHHYDLFHVSNDRYKGLIKYAYLLAKLPSRLLSRKRKKSFDDFTKKYLKLTDTRYKSFEALCENTPEADLFICGSDQIWNTLHNNGKDKAFYLNFVKTEDKKISYAASLATDRIYDNMESFIEENLRTFDSIAVRERSGIQLLSKIGIENVTHVMDPAFLLDQEEWSKIGSISFNEPYILVYDFENCERLREKALFLAKNLGAKIYTVNPISLKYADRSFPNVGPETFVSLIKGSEVVMSNSFHALVFALIFDKKFLITKRGEDINSRMEDLMSLLGIEEKLFNEDMGSLNEEARSKLNKEIESSKKYLTRILG
ncbi:polysaccharide pyruvyl transferase family protein [Vibrio breoganii]|uniref:polysaccharide pyruvyl transferase family protein n=1 Tax=Vibrio breoganii TaxID=553239 RepID=UPI000C85B0CF|nr:polysaccharide pyruvyl transferase family protein [Vibrio breoganii]PMO31946.1 hypothetical protein BCT12_17105 [Vibrio breoganii]